MSQKKKAQDENSAARALVFVLLLMFIAFPFLGALGGVLLFGGLFAGFIAETGDIIPGTGITIAGLVSLGIFLLISVPTIWGCWVIAKRAFKPKYS